MFRQMLIELVSCWWNECYKRIVVDIATSSRRQRLSWISASCSCPSCKQAPRRSLLTLMMMLSLPSLPVTKCQPPPQPLVTVMLVASVWRHHLSLGYTTQSICLRIVLGPEMVRRARVRGHPQRQDAECWHPPRTGRPASTNCC